MSIAGYLATKEGWIGFEREVEPYLTEMGVKTLRGKDFHNGHGDFKNWSREKKQSFVHYLYSIAHRHLIYGTSSTVNKKDFFKLKKRDPSLRNLSPLGLAFSSIAFSIISKDFEYRRPFLDMSLNFVVELGNKNNGNLVRYFKWIKDTWPEKTHPIGTISFVDKHDCRAVQLADFLAFHGRREADRWAKTSYDHSVNGDIFKIMNFWVPCRMSNVFDIGVGIKWKDGGFFEDGENGLLLPPEGIK